MLYGRSALQGAKTRNPVIVIPGILGSRLVDSETDRVIWGGRGREGFADQDDPEQARLIAHGMADPDESDAPLRELDDGVRPDGSVSHLRASRFGLSLQVQAYENIMRTLGVGGYLLDPGKRAHRKFLDYGHDVLSKCFEFDYDWRRSLPENAILFGEFVEAVLRFARRESSCPESLKVDVVAHSMGGLLLRYYLRYGKRRLPPDGGEPEIDWAGAANVEHVMIVGSPSAGSLNALQKLIHGLKANPLMPAYHPAILGTMPSVYQLLPRARHKAVLDADTGEPIGDLMSVERWIEREWGLAAPDADGMLRHLLPGVESAGARRQAALEHLAKCLKEAERFHRSIDTPADSPPNVVLQLFAGDGVATAAQAKVGRRDEPFRVTATAAGDGTVLRSSALMDERVGGEWYPRLLTPIRWDNVTFIATDHMALTRHPTFVNNALYLLLEKPRPACDFRVPAPPTGATREQAAMMQHG